ncbi:50S ribosomal protein L30 [Mycoplasma sp. P36-A1]|uniref:50S ribosomal protein L30 n=1 Tax=Mycoplasma sp. P36-A1 TaxID=3252900 RepID=UPI003C2E805E
MLEITLKRSLIKSKKKQIATAKALGLTKIGQTVTKQNNAATKGMITVVAHLVEVKEV